MAPQTTSPSHSPFTIKQPKFSSRNSLNGSIQLRCLRNIIQTNNETCENMIQIAKHLQNAKTNLRKCILDVQKLENKLKSDTNELKTTTDELAQLVDTLRIPLNEFNKRDRTELNLYTSIAETDVRISYTQIENIERELTIQSPIVKKPNRKLPYCYESFVIPEMSTTLIDTNENANISLCAICLTNKIDCVIYKCGHRCICYNCSRSLVKNTESQHVNCPICRSVVREVIKIRNTY